MGMSYEMAGKELKALVTYSPECCGWLQLSGFYCGKHEPTKRIYEENLRNLSSGATTIKPISDWSSARYQGVGFTLFCVLVDKQEKLWKELLTELGWVKLPSFMNPNTNNRCNPYMFIPPNCQEEGYVAYEQGDYEDYDF